MLNSQYKNLPDLVKHINVAVVVTETEV